MSVVADGQSDAVRAVARAYVSALSREAPVRWTGSVELPLFQGDARSTPFAPGSSNAAAFAVLVACAFPHGVEAASMQQLEVGLLLLLLFV